MRIFIVSLATLVFLTPGCSLNKLNNELKRADESYTYVKVAPIEPTTAGNNVVIVLIEGTSSGADLVNYRIPHSDEEAFFFVPFSDLSIAAFEDLNGDFIYQAGEPAAFIDDSSGFQLLSRGKEEPLDYDAIEPVTMVLSIKHELAHAIDLSTYSPQQSATAQKYNFLTITNWDDPAFSEANVRTGLWEPLSFLEYTGFGLYLLEELNPRKIPLLLVHGINGSPLNFQPLAEELDDRYQLLLFQYPSGFALHHTAYILHLAVEEFIKQYKYERVNILAHSMGGLVSRGMLVLNDPETNASIEKFVTLSTPWSGHNAASMGVEWSPVVAPVWTSMAPNSMYLQEIFAKALPEKMEHYLFFSYAHERNGTSKGDDGAVTVQSQLNYQAQQQAVQIYGIDDNHNGILSNPCVVTTVQILLADAQNQTGRPLLPSCSPKKN